MNNEYTLISRWKCNYSSFQGTKVQKSYDSNTKSPNIKRDPEWQKWEHSYFHFLGSEVRLVMEGGQRKTYRGTPSFIDKIR